jgi:hypothetical protein
MAGGGDFYSRDRPDKARIPEDRPRGGGPEDPRRRGTWPVWAWVLGILVLFVILTVLVG